MGEPILPDFDYTARERVQRSIERTVYERINPVGNTIVKDNPIQFDIEASDLYTSLHETELHIKYKVTAGDGTNLANDAVVSVKNLAFHSLWKTVEVHLNGNETEKCSDYPYRAYLQTLFEFDRDVLEQRGSLTGWVKDTATHMDVYTPAGAGNNAGAKKRGQMASPVHRMIGKLFTDLMSQPLSIPPGTKIMITLTPSTDAFMIGSVAGSDATVKIMDAFLRVCRHRVPKSLSILHKEMSSKKPITLETRQIRISKHLIGVGVSQATIQSLFNAPPGITYLPDRFLIGFVANTSVVGSREGNPFNFQPAAISCIEATHGDHCVAKYDLDWAAGAGGHIDAYYALLKEFGADDEYNHTINVTADDFKGGYALYPFRVVPRTLGGSVLGEKAVGNITLQVTFSTAPAAVLTCMVFAEYRGKYEILPPAAPGTKV